MCIRDSPYSAITRFSDPYARFALPFDVVDDLSGEDEAVSYTHLDVYKRQAENHPQD